MNSPLQKSNPLGNLPYRFLSDLQADALAAGMQVGGGAVQHIHQQFHSPGFDAIAYDVAEQAVAAYLRVDAAVRCQYDGFGADGYAVGHGSAEQAAGGVGIQQVVVADKA